MEKGDHSLFVGEVIQAGVNQEPEGRADEATLWLSDLGEKTLPDIISELIEKDIH